MKHLLTSETGVSEAIGFILTLGVVLLASGIIYASGLPILQQSMEASHFMEMEESFMMLGQNINEVAYERAPVRSTELKILKGTMGLDDSSSLTITVNGTTYPPYSMGSVEYYLDDQIIAYENGGMWTKYRNNDTIMRSKPQFSYSNFTTIPIMDIAVAGIFSKAGEGTARVRVKYDDDSSLYIINATGCESQITIKSKFYRGWKTYLEDHLGAEEITVDDVNQMASGNITTSYIYVDYNLLNVEIF